MSAVSRTYRAKLEVDEGILLLIEVRGDAEPSMRVWCTDPSGSPGACGRVETLADLGHAILETRAWRQRHALVKK